MGVIAWLRRLAACEYGGGIVEYVGVSGLAMLVTGWIIVMMSAQRSTIGRAMADIHARQIASFESGLGGTANTDAQLYPRVTPPRLPVISIPHVTPAQLVIGIPRLMLPALPVISVPHVTPAQLVIGVPRLVAPAPPTVSPPRVTPAQLVISIPRLAAPAPPTVSPPHVTPALPVISIPRLAAPAPPTVSPPHITPALPVIGIPRLVAPAPPASNVPRLSGSEQALPWWAKLWDELWKERERTWYRDLMERLARLAQQQLFFTEPDCCKRYPACSECSSRF